MEDKDFSQALDELKKAINTHKGKLTTLESAKRDLENSTNEIIANAIYQKKLDIEKSFDEIIREAEQRLKASEKEKSDEKKKNISKLIERDTRLIRENNIYLNNEIKRILRENKLPSFINSFFYMSIWNPTNKLESFFGFFVAIVILIIPTIISFVTFRKNLLSLFPNKATRIVIISLIYLLVIFIAGIIWLAIEKMTKKNTHALTEVIELKKNISDNKQEIKKITKNIASNTDSDSFDYTKIDREIESARIDLENNRAKKKNALDHFVNITQDEIAKTFENDSKKKKDAIDVEISKVKKELSSLQKEYDELRIKRATT